LLSGAASLLCFCGSGLAREGGLTADLFLAVVPKSKCGSELAREGGLTADLFLAVVPKSKCGSEPARESGLTADLSLAVVLKSKCGSEPARDNVCKVTFYSGKYRLKSARNAAGFTGLAR